MIPLIKSIYNNLYDRRKLVFFILIIVGFFFLGQKTLNKNPNVDKNDHQYVNSIYMSDGRIYNNYLNDEEKAMYDFMMDRIKRGKRVTQQTPEEYGCKDYKECYSLMGVAVNAIWIDHPELLSFATWDAQYKFDTGILTFRIRKSFKLPFMDDIGEMIINYKINQIVKETEGMSDKEKIKYVYNWIGQNATYDTIFTGDSKNQTIYNVFVNHNAVCAGFAKAAQVIFQRLGINSYIVRGTTTGSHMWNIVEVNGKYYYFDSTVAACIKENHYMYYDGLKQDKFGGYTLSNKEWYPKLEQTNLFNDGELKIVN